MQLWSTVTGEFIRKFGDDENWAFDISPDGSRVVTEGVDGRVRLWELQTGRLIRTFGGEEPDEPTSDEERDRRMGVVRYSPDGRRGVRAQLSGNDRTAPETTLHAARVTQTASKP